MSAKSILLVDDSRVARMLARHVVATAHPDWTITEATSGDEALALCASQSFDFIVLDMNMPGLNGLETARKLKADGSTAAITLLTANIQDPVRQQALDLGIGFMVKPVREPDLVAFLNGGAA